MHSRNSASGSISLPAWSLNSNPEFLPGAGWNGVLGAGAIERDSRADFGGGGDVLVRLTPSASLRVLFMRERRGPPPVLGSS
jgi:hypothetical protein